MGENPTEKELKYLVNRINSIYGLKFDEINLVRFIDNSVTTGSILSDVVDFLKKLGVLDEFVVTLNNFDKEFFIALFESRPKICGGNPFA